MTISDTIKSLTQTAETRTRVFGADDSSVKHALAMRASIEQLVSAHDHEVNRLRDLLVHLQHYTSCTSLQFDMIEEALKKP